MRATPFLSFFAVVAAIGFHPAFSGVAFSEDSADRASVGVSSWEGRSVAMVLSDDDLSDGRRQREALRILERAERESASMVILEMNLSSPISSLADLKILDQISESEVPVIAWINPSATGAGALLALACDRIYLSQSGIVGGAGFERDPEEEAKDFAARIAQQQSILKARARSLARLNGHPIAVAEAMVDGSREVKIGEEIVSRKGEVLTLTAGEATRLVGGEPFFAKGIANSTDEILKAESVEGETLRMTPREYGESDNRARLSRSPEGTGEGGEIGEETAETSSEEEDASDPGEKESLFSKREEGSYRDKVVVVTVGQDTLATGKASFDFMDRTIKKAELDGAAAIVFDMDTPGGFAWYTDGLVLNSLQNVSTPTYTFVNSRAESAGAIIAVGTDHIYMRPAATIGSALVVGGAGQDLAEAMSDKITQMIIGSVRNMAELKGHNPDVAEAFVTRDKEVRIDGVVIHEAGNVLNLNTIRAMEEVGGRPVLAKGVADSIEEILENEGIDAEIVKAEPLGLEAFAHWVQKLSVLLIVVGLAGAYMELNSPGFGLPGLVSVLAFSIFFFGNYLAGNLAGYELAVLLVLGLILLAVEIFLFPGAILPGAVGGALVIFALGLAMVDRVELEWKWTGLPGAESWYSIFRSSFFGLALGMVGALGAIVFGMRYLPETRLGSRFILKGAVAGGASLGSVGTGGGAGAAELGASSTGSREGIQMSGPTLLVGLSGVTTTDLLPSGKGKFEGRLLDIVSDGQFIPKGTAVKVVRHEGSRIVVAKA